MLGVEKPFLFEMAGKVAELMKEAYPELTDAAVRVAAVIRHEEQRYERTLAVALRKLDDFALSAEDDLWSSDLVQERRADGTVVLKSTPGHTPGHQSLLVHLPATGWIVLSGDAAHFKDNWDNKRVPSMNVDGAQTVASMKRLADIMAEKKAALWINHDKPQSETQRHSPQFYD